MTVSFQQIGKHGVSRTTQIKVLGLAFVVTLLVMSGFTVTTTAFVVVPTITDLHRHQAGGGSVYKLTSSKLTGSGEQHRRLSSMQPRRADFQWMSDFETKSSNHERLGAFSTIMSHNNKGDETDAIPTTVADDNNTGRREKTEKALFGMGCFWAPQETFQNLYGVESVTTGYARARAAESSQNSPSTTTSGVNTSPPPPSYLSVCLGDGHTEAILIEYDPMVITYNELLQTFWQNHDASVIYPTPQKQNQYRSAIWPLTPQQYDIAVNDLQRATEAYKKIGMKEPRTIVVNNHLLLSPSGIDNDDQSQNIIGNNDYLHNEQNPKSKHSQDISIIDQWLQNEFTKAESVHQNFWSKLRLKVTYVACATLFSVSAVPFVNDVVLGIGAQLVVLWIVWEAIELMGAAAGSFGLNHLWNNLEGKKNTQ